MRVLNELIPLQREWFNTLIPRSRTAGSIAYALFVWSRMSAPEELPTGYTTPDTTVECDRGIRTQNIFETQYGTKSRPQLELGS